MPVPGPRAQRAPAPGYRNPGAEIPDRLNLWLRPPPVAMPGRTPALMEVTLRGCVLAAGQVRRLWRQSVNLIPGQAPYSWTRLSPAPNRTELQSLFRGVEVTRALRYMTRSLYMGQGIDNTQYETTGHLHTSIPPRHRSKPVTLPAGGVKGRPTIRNRMTSFGSRVPVLNRAAPGAEDEL